MYDRDILMVKVGTSTLTKRDRQGRTSLDTESFTRIGTQLQEQHQRGNGIIVVSSAAISAGMAHTGTTERPDKKTEMPELQRLASIGWRHVVNEWDKSLGKLAVGELLVTKRDLRADDESSELMGVIDRLLIHDDVCVVNENDATSHAEIAFGDNDTLAARLAAKIRSSELFNSCVRLLILSDIDGVYTDKNDSGTVVRAINDIEQFKHLAGTASSSEGTGGMETKFMAASIAKAAGVQTVIGNGRAEGIITAMLENNAGTLFPVSS